MKTFVKTATTQKWLSLMCILLIAITFVGCATQKGTPIPTSTKLQEYVGLAVTGCQSVQIIEPNIAPTCEALNVANAGIDAWAAGTPIPANVIATLKAALTQAESEYKISTKAKELIAVLIVTIQAGLTIAGIQTTTVVAAAPATPTPVSQLRQQFNAKAPTVGAKPI